MLAIRMQRTGRKGHAQFRVVVQDAHRSPSSGRVVAQLGHYNPHTKEAVIQKDKASFYLEHGAQPSDRVVSLFQAQKIALPSWVNIADKKSRSIRNADKLRRNRPAESKPEPESVTEPTVEAATEPQEAPKEASESEPTEEVETTEAAAEAPATESEDKSEPAKA